MTERFAGVRAAFEANLASGEDVGASFCVTVGGETVVDLFGGFADEARTRPWDADTIVGVYSTTKTMTALTALLLADRGELDFGAPVARYWPEFAAAGKAEVTVAHLMSHSAGLCGWRERLTRDDLYDWEKATALLAAQEPFWKPGTASGYHAMTQGYLVGEVVRRITGLSLGRVFRDEIAGPLGADFHIGLPAADDARVAELIAPPGPAPVGGDGSSELQVNVATNPELDVHVTRTRAWRGAEIPAVGGIGNARAVAEIHAILANGGTARGRHFLSAAGCRRVLEKQVEGVDLVLGVPISFGLGFALNSGFLPNPDTVYWGGYGGSLAVIDLDARTTIAYAMNKDVRDDHRRLPRFRPGHGVLGGVGRLIPRPAGQATQPLRRDMRSCAAPSRRPSRGGRERPPLSVEEQTRPMQDNFRLFNNDLQELLQKFRSFYALEPHSVTVLQERIGGSPSDVGDGANSSVHDRLTLAFDPWLLEVMKLVDSDDWTGPAAGAFQSGFLGPFNRMGEIQKACVRELGLTAYGWNKATEAAEKNLHEIADACIYRMSNPSGLSNVAVHVLSITSLITGGLSFAPVVGVPAGVISLSTAVWTYMDTLNKQFEKKFDFYIEGNTPLQAVVSTTEVLKEIDRQLAELDEGLAKALEEDLAGGNGFAHPNIRLPQADPSGDMGQLDMSRERMVTSIVRLHRAGSTNLPIIADQYAAAASIIGGCLPPSGVVKFMGRSAGKFDGGVDMLVAVFRDTSDRATVAGEALVQTAKDYQLTDAERSEAMRQISEQQQQPTWVGDEPERAGGV